MVDLLGLGANALVPTRYLEYTRFCEKLKYVLRFGDARGARGTARRVDVPLRVAGAQSSLVLVPRFIVRFGACRDA